MKSILMRNFGTDDIERVSFKHLKSAIDSVPLIKWLQFRMHPFRDILSKRRKIVDRFKYRP